jgi:hypothetical protein
MRSSVTSLLVAVLASSSASAATIGYAATFDGIADPAASGSFSGTYDDVANTLEFQVTYQDLDGLQSLRGFQTGTSGLLFGPFLPDPGEESSGGFSEIVPWSSFDHANVLAAGLQLVLSTLTPNELTRPIVEVVPESGGSVPLLVAALAIASRRSRRGPGSRSSCPGR